MEKGGKTREIRSGEATNTASSVSRPAKTYADDTPFDRVQYLEAKLILRWSECSRLTKSWRSTVMWEAGLLTIIAALSLQPTAADEIRREAIPEAFWGTWAAGADVCKEGDASSIVLSAKAYVGSAGNCVIDYVTEIPGRSSPIYSARMRCSRAGEPTQNKTIANLIIRPDTAGQVSLGSTFESVTAHHRCAANAPAAKQ